MNETTQSLLKSVATPERIGWIKKFMASDIPNPDKILNLIGRKMSVLTELRYDTHLASIIQSRKAGVLSLEWELTQADGSASEKALLQSIFDELNIPKIISEMLEAPLYGYKFLEIVWRMENGYLIPKDLIGKPSEWFTFGKNNVGYFNRTDGSKVPVNPNKFILIQHNSTYDNPYGEALLSKCFYPITFKRNVVKFWSIYLEKFGMPFLVGKVTDISNTDTDEFLKLLNDLRHDGVTVLDDGLDLTTIDLTKASSPDMFKEFIHFFNSELSKAIISQTLTTEQGATGSYAMSQTHLQVRSDIVNSDKRLVERAFNELIKNIYQLNFGHVNNIPKFNLYEEQDVDKVLAERDVLLNGIGVKFNKDYFQRNYGLKQDEFDIMEVQPTPAFSKHSHNHSIADELENFTEEDKVTKAQEKIFNHIMDIVSNSKDLDDAIEKVKKAVPEIDETEITELLNSAYTTGMVGGIVNADV